MKITVLVLDQVFDTGLSTLLDTLALANSIAASEKIAGACFDVSLVAVRRKVVTGQGMVVPVGRIETCPPPDVALLPALNNKSTDAVCESLRRRDVADAGDHLKAWSERGAVLGAACNATFLLAETKLLDGQGATTTWWHAPRFRERYPLVALDASRMLVHSGGFVTVGAALAHLDLALWCVRRVSPTLAALTARYLLMDPRRSQAAFAISEHLVHEDPLVERFETWARAHLVHGFSLPEAARAAGTSERTLARRINAVLGKSPLSYFQDIRVERAVHLLKTSQANVDQIAAQVGYADGVTLRTLIRRRIGRGVRELRAGD